MSTKRLSARTTFDEASVKFSNYRILITDDVHRVCADTLRKAGLIVDEMKHVTTEQLENLLPNYDAWIVSETKVTADLLSYATQLKYIGRAVAGLENIDMLTKMHFILQKAATRRGIAVMDTPGGHVVSSAEHTVGLLLCVSQGIELLCEEGVKPLTKSPEEVKDLRGRTVALWGLGVIGREIAIRCRGLGMKVKGYDPSLREEEIELKIELKRAGIDFRDDLHSFCEDIDFLIINQLVHSNMSPVGSEASELESEGETPMERRIVTRPLPRVVGSKLFAMCPAGVSVLLSPRCSTVDLPALEAALVDGSTVAAVAIANGDCCRKDLVSLFQNERCIFAPLSGSSTAEAEEKLAREVADQIVSAFSGDLRHGLTNALMHGLSQDVIPYIELVDVLGTLSSQIMEGQLSQVRVVCYGDVFVEEEGQHTLRKSFKAAILRGILSDSLNESVNYVNAPHIGRCLGMKVHVDVASMDALEEAARSQTALVCPELSDRRIEDGYPNAETDIKNGDFFRGERHEDLLSSLRSVFSEESATIRWSETTDDPPTFLSPTISPSASAPSLSLLHPQPTQRSLPTTFSTSLYASLVVVEVETTQGTVVVSGTVSSQGEVLITSITGFPVEIVPQRTMLLYWSEDKPGMLHDVASVLCRAGAGILSLVVGRRMTTAREDGGRGGRARRRRKEADGRREGEFVLTVVNISSVATSHSDMEKEIGSIKGIRKAMVVKLPQIQ